MVAMASRRRAVTGSIEPQRLFGFSAWMALAALLLLTLLAASPERATAEPIPPPDEASRPTIGLALGSGGANGLAHIAMLQVFDELGIVPDRIAGTSIGAIIGSLYAAGLSADEILDLFDDVAGSPLDALTGLTSSDLDLVDLLQIGIGDGGLFSSMGFLRYLALHTEARDFSELRIPMQVVATDYWTGDSVVLEEGPLFPALEGSMAVPGLFAPVPHLDMLLIDGGTSNPLPFDLLQDEVDMVIAVDVSGNRDPFTGHSPGLTEMLLQSFKIMQQSIARQRLNHRPPDLYLKPESHGIRLLHFNRIHEILQQAEPTATELRQQLMTWQASHVISASPGYAD
ncbi:patatin-like phospholipase family protein [Billgrantia desiderata]|uniref:patatin-like phospholipase family protein n=1 Tax=Billgrantia desiderata TaxID=52021 RepID=UPI001F22D543|nr:patatin-like phospholipase family protein [Halomonas desiderata]MCE8011469.1 patatin-like phospholipase family protein [Halomonas desiderata]